MNGDLSPDSGARRILSGQQNAVNQEELFQLHAAGDYTRERKGLKRHHFLTDARRKRESGFWKETEGLCGWALQLAIFRDEFPR
jgi:hypothetical protein